MFYQWLKRLLDKEVKIETSFSTYEGKLFYVDKDTLLVKETSKVNKHYMTQTTGNKMSVIKVGDVTSIRFKRDDYKLSPLKHPKGHPLCRWLKKLERKDVKLTLYLDGRRASYEGEIIRTENELFVFVEDRHYNHFHVFQINSVVDISSEAESFSFRVEVEFSEIE